MAHPRVIHWQSSWMIGKSEDDEMDCDEAVERSRTMWDMSAWKQSLPTDN